MDKNEGSLSLSKGIVRRAYSVIQVIEAKKNLCFVCFYESLWSKISVMDVNLLVNGFKNLLPICFFLKIDRIGHPC